NAAIERLAEDYGAEKVGALLLPENRALLHDVWLYHLLDDSYDIRVMYRNFTNEYPNLLGDSFTLALSAGETRQLAQVGPPYGVNTYFIDPDNPDNGVVTLQTYFVSEQRTTTTVAPIREVYFSLENYRGGVQAFDFWTYLRNSLIVTIAATTITLIINSMAAFALSKYKFKGRNAVFLIIISTLMVPISVILIPAFLVISEIGWHNNLWGVIIPGA